MGGGIYNQQDKQYIKEVTAMKDGFSNVILDELCRILNKINVYFFCSQKQILPLFNYFINGKKCNWNIISWHKSNPVPACGNKYLTDTEFILFFREKGVKVFGNFNTKRTFYVTPINQADKKRFGHPTIKPLEIVHNLIVNSSKEGEIVLDPFLGSGTTAVAAAKTNRHYIGFEINEQYFDIACSRLDDVEQEKRGGGGGFEEMKTKVRLVIKWIKEHWFDILMYLFMLALCIVAVLAFRWSVNEYGAKRTVYSFHFLVSFILLDKGSDKKEIETAILFKVMFKMFKVKIIYLEHV